jgi:uncharacterized membrane protein
MPTLVVIAYRDETSAATAGEQVQRLVRHLRIEPDAIAVVRRDRDGRYHLTTNHHHPVARDVAWGTVWTLVFALLFAPAPADAGLRALLELVAAGGLDERFRTEIRDRLDPGTSALFLALGDEQLDRVVDVLGSYGGEVLQTTMTGGQLAALQEALHGGAAPVAEPALSAGRDRARGTG